MVYPFITIGKKKFFWIHWDKNQ